MKKVFHVMTQIFKPAAVVFLVLTVVCGLIYPLAITAIGQTFFSEKVNGSLVSSSAADGETTTYGSSLIGQNFDEPQYLIGRPQGEQNLSPTSGEQQKIIEQRVAWWRKINPQNQEPIPVDLVTTSASGVDPNISPEAAEFQVARIAQNRNISEYTVREIIQQHTTGRLWGFWGEPHVNVLEVNIALDGL